MGLIELSERRLWVDMHNQILQEFGYVRLRMTIYRFHHIIGTSWEVFGGTYILSCAMHYCI